MIRRRDFLQYLGIGGLVAAVHNVDALGITTIEKKLIVPKRGAIKIYTGIPGDPTSVLLATLDLNPNFESELPLTAPVITTGIANWARIEHHEYGDFDVPVGGEKDNKPISFDTPYFIKNGVVSIHSLVFGP